jgi:hypothetical protein
MLLDPRIKTGEGARYRCPVCYSPIAIKRTGVRRRFCSDRCQGVARRERDFATKVAPYTGDTANPTFSPTKSIPCKGSFADPRSSAEAPIGVLGHRNRPWPNPQHGNRAKLITNAIATELAARWPIIGKGRVR